MTLYYICHVRHNLALCRPQVKVKTGLGLRSPAERLGFFYFVCKVLFTIFAPMKHLDTSKMTAIEAIEFRIRQSGIKKKKIAEQVGLSPVELSHLLSGNRKYEREKNLLLRHLGIKIYIS